MSNGGIDTLIDLGEFTIHGVRYNEFAYQEFS